MNHSEKFVCLSYPELNVFIPQKNIPAVLCCKTEDFADGKLKISSIDNKTSFISFIDFDLCAQSFFQHTEVKKIKTAFLISNEQFSEPIFESEKNLTVVTSAECFVIEKDASSFSLFSPLYFEHLKKMGIFACSFSENKFGILIDIRKFLDFYNKKTKTIKSVKKK